MNLMEQGEAAKRVLCGANSYIEKYFFNPRFQNLPEEVKENLQKISVVYTEEIGGIILLQFDEEGKLDIACLKEEDDFLYDTIGAELKRRQIFKDYKELFSKLEEYYAGLLQIEKEKAKS